MDKNKVGMTVVISGLFGMGAYIIHKINKVQEEIEYLERRKGIYRNYKEYHENNKIWR